MPFAPEWYMLEQPNVARLAGNRLTGRNQWFQEWAGDVWQQPNGLWTDSLGFLYHTKAEAMVDLQYVDFRREQRIMNIHYGQYMTIYHTVIQMMLQGLAPGWKPVVRETI